MPQFAKVFRSGNSQAVRLPTDFRFDVESDKRAEIAIHERTPGLPPNSAPARPAGLPPPVTPMTATTISSDRLVFR